MKKITVTTVLVLVLASFASAQFYYKDIISNNQLIKEMAIYKENKIRSVIIKSFDDDGSESDGFICEKNISKNYRKTELFTRTNVSSASLFISTFNTRGLLEQTYDSSVISVSINKYSYNDQNKIISILSTVRSVDDDYVNEIVEEHIYVYNEKNIPEKMVRVKNKFDSTIILFLADENNNISMEKDTKSGSKYYYYYDPKNRLTDIVHSYEFKPDLKAEYLFEYNNLDQLSQMTSIEEGGSDYYIWKYTYNDRLRSMEKCYSKEKRLMGRIEYGYK